LNERQRRRLHPVFPLGDPRHSPTRRRNPRGAKHCRRRCNPASSGKGARSTNAATYARIARTYLGARVSAISDIHPDAVAIPTLARTFFAFKPLDRFIRVRRACRLGRRVMPQAWLRVLIKE